MSKILVIDDASFVRLNMRTFLEEQGFEVDEAENGEVALEVYDRFMPDLVFCDITMPVLDGMGFLRGVLRKHADAKVVMLTSTNEPSIITEAWSLGATKFMVKPFNRETTLKIIKSMLG